MSTFNQNSGTAVPTLINSSATILTANAVSSNALTVRQFGTGNVFSAQTTTGSTALFVGANGNVGVGTTGPVYQLSVATGLGATATPTVQILDTVGPKSLSVVTNASSGVYNAMVATGDTLMVAGVGSTVNTGVLTLAPWSAGSVGARIGGSSNIFGIYSNATTFYSNAVSPATVMTVVNGRVGIGTTNPTEVGAPGSLLHIYDNTGNNPTLTVDATGSTGQARIRLKAGFAPSTFRANRVDYYSNTNIIWTQITDYNQNGTNDMNFHSLGKGYASGGVLTLTQAGNVGIGTTSPSYLLDLGGGDIRTQNGGNVAGAGGAINFGANVGYGPMAQIKGALDTAAGSVNDQGSVVFLTRPLEVSPYTVRTNLTERMRITSGGLVGIGTTNPSGKLTVATSGGGTSAGGGWDANWSVVHGTTVGAAGGGVGIAFNDGNFGLLSCVTPSIGWRTMLYSAGRHDFYLNGTFALAMYNLMTGGATTISVDAGGGLQRGAVSDRRLKSNIVTMTDFGLKTITDLRPVTYEATPESLKRIGAGVHIGLVAQEVQTVFPYAVSADQDEQKTLTIDYIKLVPVMINAFKELSAENKALEARLAALEKAMLSTGTAGS